MFLCILISYQYKRIFLLLKNITLNSIILASYYIDLLMFRMFQAHVHVDGAPVWHSVSRRGAGCCL